MSSGLRFAREIMGLASLTSEWAVTVGWLAGFRFLDEKRARGVIPIVRSDARRTDCVMCLIGS